MTSSGCVAPTKSLAQNGVGETKRLPQGSLVTEAKTKRLSTEIEALKTMQEGVYGVSGVVYPIKDSVLTGINLGVYVSVEQAVDSLQKMRLASYGKVLNPEGIGDSFSYTVSPGSDVGQKGGLIKLRRKNVTVIAGWKEDTKSAIDFARKLDQLILNSDEIFPKGKVVPTPDIKLTLPTKVAPKANFKVNYKAPKGVKVLASNSSGSNSWSEEGELLFYPRELGQFQATMTFATATNVIFSKTVSVEVVPQAQITQAQEKRKWEWFSELLYFKPTAEQDYEFLPFEQREWIDLHPGTFNRLDEPEAEEVKQQIQRDLARVVPKQWLPETEFMQVFRDVSRPADTKAFFATFATGKYHVLYFGVVGGWMSLYIESPADAATPTPSLKAAQVVLPNVMPQLPVAADVKSDPPVEFQSRNLTRYRAFEQNKPYQSVQIFLMRFRLAEALNLNSMGYDLPVLKSP